MRAPFVKEISGHKSGGCLDRYEHVEVVGDKFDKWPWLDAVLKGDFAEVLSEA